MRNRRYQIKGTPNALAGDFFSVVVNECFLLSKREVRFFHGVEIRCKSAFVKIDLQGTLRELKGHYRYCSAWLLLAPIALLCLKRVTAVARDYGHELAADMPRVRALVSLKTHRAEDLMLVKSAEAQNDVVLKEGVEAQRLKAALEARILLCETPMSYE
ncbi:hypothetical protein TNCV_187311 [Trichonephila clavipes]|nr:hypothetical protein TNCV_187311 [Trichonephila clavipes]